MRFDLHTNHERCGHAKGAVRDYIQSAVEQGLHIIGISDHSPFFYSDDDQPYPANAMAKSEFPGYVAEVLSLKKQFAGQITVLLGVESDFIPEHRDLYAEIYRQYPFDYVIGSAHRTSGTPIFDNPSPGQLLRQAENYYQLVREAAGSGLFQVIGHMDGLKRTNPDMAAMKTDALDDALRAIANCGVAIEVNTSGLSAPCDGWYPSYEILERAFHFGVDVTFGSDAHSPAQVADDWEHVRLLLKEIGFREWTIFHNRKPCKFAL